MSAHDNLSRYNNPMLSLSEALDDLEYPQPPSDTWVRVLLTLTPCSILILSSIFWEWGAPFLLVFAGAFASIQLIRPYEHTMALVRDHLNEAREQQQPPVEWTRNKLRFHTTASTFQGSMPIGYSPAGLARAKRRFPRLARRWRRSFHDVNGRVVSPGASSVSPAAIEAWLHRGKKSFNYWDFVRRASTIRGRVALSLVGLVPTLFSRAGRSWSQSPWVIQQRKRRAEIVLQKIGTELIRATMATDGDITVSTLAAQLELSYEPPEIREGWVSRKRPHAPETSIVSEMNDSRLLADADKEPEPGA